ALATDPRWRASCRLFATSDAYQLIKLRSNAGQGDLAALCLVTFYEEPMAESSVLAVEALWLASADAALHRPLWATLIAKAHAMNMEGVCVPPALPGARSLAQAGAIDGHPVLGYGRPAKQAARR